MDEQLSAHAHNVGPPYLGAAVFCERVIEGIDSVFTLVRLYDELNITLPAEIPDPTPEAPLRFELYFFIALKATNEVVWEPVDVVVQPPRDVLRSQQHLDSNPAPDKANVNLDGRMNLPVSGAGIYWVEVRFGKRVLTRIPLQINLLRVEGGEEAVRL